MDWHKLQHILYNLDPTDPRDDLARLQQSAQKPADDIPTIDYVNESVEVPKGSMPLNINSVNDFARLAGVEPRKQINEDDDDDKPTRGFAAGLQAVQKGGKWGPDAVSNRMGKMVTPDKPDKKKSKTQATSSNVKLVDRSRQKDFDEALIGINQLPSGAKMGVKVAYLYYQKLFDKIKSLPPETITQQRIRIPNARKLSLLLGTYFGMKLGWA